MGSPSINIHNGNFARKISLPTVGFEDVKELMQVVLLVPCILKQLACFDDSQIPQSISGMSDKRV